MTQNTNLPIILSYLTQNDNRILLIYDFYFKEVEQVLLIERFESIQEVDYIEMTGVDITQFIMQMQQSITEETFMSTFKSKMEQDKHRFQRIKMNKNTKYKLYEYVEKRY